MKNLNEMNLMELDSKEQKETEGGMWGLIIGGVLLIGAAVAVTSAIDAYHDARTKKDAQQ
jgi:hypothetical protein